MRETGYYTGSEGQFLCAEDFRALSVPLKVKAEQQNLKHADETSLSPVSPITPPMQPSPPLISPAGSVLWLVRIPDQISKLFRMCILWTATTEWSGVAGTWRTMACLVF
ncbi:unnamed protein product [Wuchereria bancrofti]|uniref:Uncharacterized protein n=1 Tax=Wuchereria bancrofti TaxID=6293 RepID=A0A3P7G424_WUCBA|nr:unnamed protein product [Wuchereria bancrofti]